MVDTFFSVSWKQRYRDKYLKMERKKFVQKKKKIYGNNKFIVDTYNLSKRLNLI